MKAFYWVPQFSGAGGVCRGAEKEESQTKIYIMGGYQNVVVSPGFGHFIIKFNWQLKMSFW